MSTKTGPVDMHKALNANRNMEKMFLPWLEGSRGGCEVRHALTHIHLSPFYLSSLLPHFYLPLPHTYTQRTRRRTNARSAAEEDAWKME